MKKVLFLMINILWLAAARAGAYESPLGFSIDLPSHWNVVNKQVLKKDPRKYGSLGESKKEILNGKAEIYENLSARHDKVNDAIFVHLDRGGMRPIKAMEKQICNETLLQKAFSRSLGRKVKVYACKVVRVSNYDAIYLDFDGAQPGSRSLQYQIWKPSNDTITLTLTTRSKSLEKVRDEFTALIFSLDLNR